METTKKYIANNIVVDLAKSRLIDDNGKYGDARLEIWQEAATDVTWVETNGDPIVCEDLDEALAILANVHDAQD